MTANPVALTGVISCVLWSFPKSIRRPRSCSSN